MENRVFGIESSSLKELTDTINQFSKGKKVFATQTHVLGGGDFTTRFYAFLYYEYDDLLANEKPSRSLNKDNYFAKPNNSPEPSDNSVPASPKQVFSLVKNYGYTKEAAEKLSMKEAYQIIKEKKRSSK